MVVSAQQNQIVEVGRAALSVEAHVVCVDEPSLSAPGKLAACHASPESQGSALMTRGSAHLVAQPQRNSVVVHEQLDTCVAQDSRELSVAEPLARRRDEALAAEPRRQRGVEVETQHAGQRLEVGRHLHAPTLVAGCHAARPGRRLEHRARPPTGDLVCVQAPALLEIDRIEVLLAEGARGLPGLLEESAGRTVEREVVPLAAEIVDPVALPVVDIGIGLRAAVFRTAVVELREDARRLCGDRVAQDLREQRLVRRRGDSRRHREHSHRVLASGGGRVDRPDTVEPDRGGGEALGLGQGVAAAH